MGKKFFVDWALWEKMCFVLTFVAGFVKLAYTHWKLRKYTAIAEARKNHLQEMRRCRHIIPLRGEDVPFGIRAIESGIEVEGVWISRPNSPAPTIRSFAPPSPGSGRDGASSFDASPKKHGPAPSASSLLSIPQPVHGPPTNHSLPSPRASSVYTRPASPSDRVRARSAEILPLRPTIPALTADSGRQVRAISPSSYHYDALRPDQRSLLAPDGRGSRDGQEGLGGPRTPRRAGDGASRLTKSGSGSSSTSDGLRSVEVMDVPLDEGGTRPSWSSAEASSQGSRLPSSQRYSLASGSPFDDLQDETHEITPATTKRRSQLESLHSHRLTHAAEVGQLVPRNRRALSDDWTGWSQAPGHRYGRGADQPVKDRRTSYSENDVRPLTTAARGANGSSPPALAGPFMSGANQTALASGADVSYVSEPPLQGSMQQDRPAVTRPLQLGDVNQHLQNAASIRRVNSGFEVLPPNSLPPPDAMAKGISRSEELMMDVEAGEGRPIKHKKLQKKNRPKSTKGRVSTFMEHI
ncbi:MAG: hypothetical protein M1832_005078 [Thelocarpon impressellum]|nr:MAG: hypothetical protein M1832_005078 [Thelocarpon impressellum]